MSKPALARKQQPRWEVYHIEPANPQQTQGPSDLLEQSKHYAKYFTNDILSGTAGGTHDRTRHGFYQSYPVSVIQGSTEFSGKWLPLKEPSDFFQMGTLDVGGPKFEFIKIPEGSMSGWYDVDEFQVNWETVKAKGTSGSHFVVLTGGPSSIPLEPAPTEPSLERPDTLDTLQRRYKELNSKSYVGELTTAEKAELQEVERRLDDLDAQDNELKEVANRIEKGYDELRDGLSQINKILDELLKD
jgi:hypothetical protein